MPITLKLLQNIALVSLIVFSSLDTRAQDSLKFPVWRARLIAADLVRADSIASENVVLNKKYIILQSVNQLHMDIIEKLKLAAIESEKQKSILQQQVEIVEGSNRKLKIQRVLLASVIGAVVILEVREELRE
jgi:hypothetical protein